LLEWVWPLREIDKSGQCQCFANNPRSCSSVKHIWKQRLCWLVYCFKCVVCQMFCVISDISFQGHNLLLHHCCNSSKWKHHEESVPLVWKSRAEQVFALLFFFLLRSLLFEIESRISLWLAETHGDCMPYLKMQGTETCYCFSFFSSWISYERPLPPVII